MISIARHGSSKEVSTADTTRKVTLHVHVPFALQSGSLSQTTGIVTLGKVLNYAHPNQLRCDEYLAIGESRSCQNGGAIPLTGSMLQCASITEITHKLCAHQ